MWYISLIVDQFSKHIDNILNYWFIKKHYLAWVKAQKFRADNKKAHGHKNIQKTYNSNNNKWR
jgi:hypothetical protein